MTAPLSLTDKQYQYLVGIYGPGLSFNDMLQRYYGNGNKSVDDLAGVYWQGNNSQSDDKYQALPGSGSLSDKQYASSTGGVAGGPIDILTGTTPFYVGHRGSGDVWPEHTMVGYTGAKDAGLKGIEVSCQISSDNWWFCLHDTGATGLDRATNGTGDPSTKTKAQLQALIVDLTNCGPYYPAQNLPLPDLIAVLDMLIAAGSVIFLETKNYNNTPMDLLISLLQSRYPNTYKSQVIWKSHVSNAAGFTKATAAGMKKWAYVDYPLVPQQITDAMSRADYIGIPRYDDGSGLTDAEVDTVISMAGAVKVISWEPKRRAEIAKLLAKGVDGFVSPQGPYSSVNYPNRVQDNFASGQWAAGDIPFDAGRAFILNASSAWFNSASSNPSVCMGSMSPAGNYFEISFEMKYDTLPVTTNHSGIAFSKPDDQRWQFQLANPTGGYHVVLRANGQLQLYKHDPGVTSGTQLGSTITTTALDTVNWAKVRVRVDGTGIQAQRMDGTPSTIITSTDSSYRGTYFHLSRNHSLSTTDYVRFRNVTVTQL